MITLPVTDVVMPSALAGQQNGRLSPALLVSIPDPTGGATIRLLAVAARSRAALVQAAALAGFKLKSTSSADGYRDIAQQEAAFTSHYSKTVPPGLAGTGRTWNGVRWYRLPDKSIVAVPGTSNHGWGIANDYAEERDGDPGPESLSDAAVEWLVANAHLYGWSAELQPEPWHWRHVTGDTLTPAVLAYEASLSDTGEADMGLSMMAYDETGNVWVGQGPGGHRALVGSRAGGVNEVPTGWSGAAWSVAYWYGRVGADGRPGKPVGAGTGLVAWRTDQPAEAGPRNKSAGLAGDVMCGCPYVAAADLDALLGTVESASSPADGVGDHEHSGGTSGAVIRV